MQTAMAAMELGTVTAALLGAAAYGSGDFIGGRAALRITPFGAVALAQAVAMGVMLSTFHGDGALLPEGGEWPASVLAGLAYSFGLVLLYHGIAHGRIAVVAPLCGIVSVLIPLAGDIVLQREVTTQQFAGIGLCFAAIVLIAGSVASSDGLRDAAPSVRLGIFSGIGYGVADLCLGIMQPETANGGLMITRSVAALSAAFVLVVVLLRRAQVPILPPAAPVAALAAGPFALAQPTGRQVLRSGLVLAAVAGFFDVLGHMGYVHAATQGSMGVAAALVALFPAVSVLLAIVILKERITGMQWAGLGVCLCGVILLAG